MANSRKERNTVLDKNKKHPIASGDAKREWVRMVAEFLRVQTRVASVELEDCLLFAEKILNVRRELAELLRKLLGVDDSHSCVRTLPIRQSLSARASDAFSALGWL